jgi:chromosome condensin MukBEF MukE localization factor
MKTWQIEVAQTCLSDGMDSAQREGPQEITEHGKSVAFVVSRQWFDQRLSLLDKQELLLVVQQRLAQWRMHPEQVSELSRSDLERIARGTSTP